MITTKQTRLSPPAQPTNTVGTVAVVAAAPTATAAATSSTNDHLSGYNTQHRSQPLKQTNTDGSAVHMGTSNSMTRRIDGSGAPSLLGSPQAPPTSLTNASLKIKQRQQKFLAAAAKSATSPTSQSKPPTFQPASMVPIESAWRTPLFPSISARSSPASQPPAKTSSSQAYADNDCKIENNDNQVDASSSQQVHHQQHRCRQRQSATARLIAEEQSPRQSGVSAAVDVARTDLSRHNHHQHHKQLEQLPPPPCRTDAQDESAQLDPELPVNVVVNAVSAAAAAAPTTATATDAAGSAGAVMDGDTDSRGGASIDCDGKLAATVAASAAPATCDTDENGSLRSASVGVQSGKELPHVRASDSGIENARCKVQHKVREAGERDQLVRAENREQSKDFKEGQEVGVKFVEVEGDSIGEASYLIGQQASQVSITTSISNTKNSDNSSSFSKTPLHNIHRHQGENNTGSYNPIDNSKKQNIQKNLNTNPHQNYQHNHYTNNRATTTICALTSTSNHYHNNHHHQNHQHNNLHHQNHHQQHHTHSHSNNTYPNHKIAPTPTNTSPQTQQSAASHNQQQSATPIVNKSEKIFSQNQNCTTESPWPIKNNSAEGVYQQQNVLRQPFYNLNTNTNHINHNHNNISDNNYYNQNQNHLHIQQTQPQPPPHYQQQHVMAHYKFHNDCQSSVLTYEQVKRLDHVMDQTVPIHGRGNFPTLFVKLKELIRLVKYKLQKEHSIEIRDVRLNGGAASYVLAPENSHYNDLDLVFGTDLADGDRFDVIRDVVLECLLEFYPIDGKQEQSDTERDSLCESLTKSTVCTGASSSDEQQDFVETKIMSSSSFESNIPDITPYGSNGLEEVCGLDDETTRKACDNFISENVVQQVKDGDQEGVKISAKEDCSNVTDSHNSEDKKSRKDENEILGNRSHEKDTSTSYQQPQQQVLQKNLYSYHQMPLNNCAIKEAYVHKMVKVNDDDRWSLISLGVQQSEANCCDQQLQEGKKISANSGGQTNAQHFSNINPIASKQAEVNGSNNQQQCAAAPAGGATSACGCNRASADVNWQACSATSANHRAKSHHHHQSMNQYHQKQFPNSIELKFVDRMRRKFEFSVDSFQIILDSLIQFYDYAPQSTITIQRKLANSHPSSTMINTRPLINKKRCTGCLNERRTSFDCKTYEDDESGCSNRQDLDNHNRPKNYPAIGNYLSTDYQKQQQHERRHRGSMLNESQSYYQLPLQQENLPSESSVASSSGCSSSSSVVSSSSSSLSCDEDPDDLYCDADSSPSSSVSTSSLLSTTTMSMISSTGSPSKNQTQQPRGFYVRDLCDLETTKASCAVISENFYPTVIGHSEYGNFKEALYHLERKLIATRSPEEIRGGGLLKYCNLLVKNYKPTNVYQIRTLERYMCSRFFIDFSDLNQQCAKLESYLANHFTDPLQKFDYLTILHNVVQRSTVCLMNHELRLTLNMIRDLAYKLNEQQIHQQQVHNQNHQRALIVQQAHLKQPAPALAAATQVDQQRKSASSTEQQQHYYHQQKPVVAQSGVYRVKLINYTLAKPARPCREIGIQEC